MDKIKGFFKKFFKSRNFKYGSNSIILVAFVIAIAIVVNIVLSPEVLGKLVGKDTIKWDLTQNKLFTIGDESKKVLNDLKKDVTIYGLFDEGQAKGSSYNDITDFLEQYEKYDTHIKVLYKDPDKNLSLFNTLDPDNLKGLAKGDFLVVSGKNMKKISYNDLYEQTQDQNTGESKVSGQSAEQAFTGAIKYVTADTIPTVYFVTGHGELSLTSDYTTIKKDLESYGFDSKELKLMSVEKVPDDAQAIIIPNPKSDFAADEITKLKDFQKKGGNLVVMADASERTIDFKNLNGMLKESYYVQLNNDKVKENNDQNYVPKEPYHLAAEVADSTLFPQNFPVVLNNSRSISKLKNSAEYITVTPVISTSETGESEKIDKTEGANVKGVTDIAVRVENNGGSKPSKLMVIGNASFISDSMSTSVSDSSYYQYSRYFFVGSLMWMLNKTDDISIPAKSLAAPVLQITQSQANTAALFAVVIIPLLILALGMFVWMRRRHL